MLPTAEPTSSVGDRRDPTAVARGWAVDSNSWHAAETGADISGRANRWLTLEAAQRFNPTIDSAATAEPVGNDQAAWVDVTTDTITADAWTGRVTVTRSPGTSPGKTGPEGESTNYTVTATRTGRTWAITDITVAS